MKTYTLKLDQACKENWNNMKPREDGNYCELCAKTVVDFTGLSQQEILEKMKASKGNTCARVTKSQLNTPIIAIEKDYQFHFPYSKVAASLLIATTISCTQAANKQQDEMNPEYSLAQFADKESYNASEDGSIPSSKNTPSNVTTFSGKIISGKSGEPIENAKVTFFTLNKIFTTNTAKDGTFLLRIPSYLIDEDNVIRVSYRNIVVSESEKKDLYSHYYETDDLILTKEDITGGAYVFKAEPDYMVLGGIGMYRNREENPPIVLQNGVEVKYKEFSKALRGQKSKCNIENTEYYYFDPMYAIALYGEKARNGLYLIINED